MPVDSVAHRMPRFYGSVTVGERGQVSIPADARRDLSINPSDKLLAFGGPDGRVLMFMKFEAATEIIESMATAVSEIKAVMESNSPHAGCRAWTREVQKR